MEEKYSSGGFLMLGTILKEHSYTACEVYLENCSELGKMYSERKE